MYADTEVTYLFGMDDGDTIIDGFGTAAFVNHCCDPNCETDELRRRIWIIALRDIEAGEELTYDYNLYDGDRVKTLPAIAASKAAAGRCFPKKRLRARKNPA